MRLCECGCGDPAPIAVRSDPRYGHVRGEAHRFISGHQLPRPRSTFVVDEKGCWIWQGKSRSGNGYGLARVRGGRRVRAHRMMYEKVVGPLPDGMHLHHRCGEKLCVNPEHLEPLTQREHLALHRGEPRSRGSKQPV